MDLCVVNVVKLRQFSWKKRELLIELNGEEGSEHGLIRHFIVNGIHNATIAHDHYLYSSQPNSIEEDIDYLRTLLNDAIKRGEPWTRKLW